MPTVLSTSRHPQSVTRVIGQRSNYTSSVWQDLWEGPTDRVPFPDTPASLELVSANAANAAAGTGAQQVRLSLLDADFVLQYIDVELNGVTAVPIPGGPWLRCNKIRTIRAGSYNFVEGGNIDLQVAGGGAVWRRMIVDTNEDRSGVYTVPANYEVSLSQYDIKLTGRTQNAKLDAEFQIREQGGAWQITGAEHLDETDNASGSLGDDAVRVPGPGTDFRLSVFPTGNPDRCILNALIKEYTTG